MQDRSVAAEGNEQVGPLDLLGQLANGQAQVRAITLLLKGKAHNGLKARLIQDRFGLGCHMHILIPIWIGAQYDFSLFHSLHSFSVLCEASTMAFRSICALGSSDLRKKPRYSIFPSGPRMGEYVIPSTVK